MDEMKIIEAIEVKAQMCVATRTDRILKDLLAKERNSESESQQIIMQMFDIFQTSSKEEKLIWAISLSEDKGKVNVWVQFERQNGKWYNKNSSLISPKVKNIIDDIEKRRFDINVIHNIAEQLEYVKNYAIKFYENGELEFRMDSLLRTL